MTLDKNFFVKQKFSKNELGKYKGAARRDLEIAKTNKDVEVIFHFTFMALIKLGIYLIAFQGYRIKSRPGHHEKIIETLSQLLHNEDVLIVGQKMRKDRNLDLYSAGIHYSASETATYVQFVSELIKNTK